MITRTMIMIVIVIIIFVLIVMLLNYKLRKYKGGYKFTKLQKKLNHFMYMNYIKIFAENKKRTRNTYTFLISFLFSLSHSE